MRELATTSILLLGLALAGRGSVRLYDKSADQLATSIRVDYDAGKIMNVLVLERGTVEALEKREIDAFVKKRLWLSVISSCWE